MASIMSTVTEATILLDAKLRVAAWGDSATRLFGIEPDTAWGRDFAALTLAPTSRQVWRRWLRDMHQGRSLTASDQQVTGQGANGEQFPLRISLDWLQLPDDAQVLVSARVRRNESMEQVLSRPQGSITDAQHLEKERLKLTMEGGRVHSVDWQIDERIVIFDGWSRVFGVAAETDVSPHAQWLERIHVDDIGSLRSKIIPHLKGETEYYEHTHRMRHVDGSWRWINERGKVLAHDDAGRASRLVGIVADVTEIRTLAEDAKHQRYMLSAIIESLPIGVWVKDCDGRYLQVNKVFRDLLAGIDVIGKTDADLPWPEQVREQIQRDDKAILENGISIFGQQRTIRADTGERLHITTSGRRLYSLHGEVIGFIGTFQDITDSKNNEAKMREDHKRIELAVASTKLGMADWNIKTGRVNFDDRWAKNLGYETRALQPTIDQWRALVHPDDMPKVRAALDKYLKGEAERYEHVHRMQHCDGSWRWVQDYGRVVEYDQQGRPLRMIGTNLDVSERVQGNQAIAESERRFRNMADATPAFIWLWDTDNKIIYANRTWREFVDADENTPCDVLCAKVHPEDEKAVHEVWGWSVKRRDSFEAIYRIEGCDGNYVWVQELGRPRFTDSGEYIGYISAAFDVNKVVAAEKAQEHARERAEEAALVKTNFVANMSHELRTPLNAVLGMLEVITDSELNDEQQQYIDIAIQAGRALLELINDILDFSKIETNSQQLECIEFDLLRLIDDVIEIVALQADQKGLELIVTVNPDVPRFVRGDPARLRQIMVNLLGNGVKFTAEGSVAVTVVRKDHDPKYLSFSVKDTGIGIAADALEKVFLPFTQADNSTSRLFGGTGLGLSICQQFVNAMGGSIEVNSIFGKGSEFCFELPLPPARSASDNEVQRVVHCALIVCERRRTATSIAHHLSRLGVRYEWVANFAVAEARFAHAMSAGNIDLVVCDVDEPDVTEVRSLAARLADKTQCMLAAPARSPLRRVLRDVVVMAVRPISYTALEKRVCAIDAKDAGVDEKPLQTNSAGIKVLVVDDVESNLAVAKAVLRRLGVDVHTANGGREALRMAKSNTYDMVFMDCQMPEIDGYETTQLMLEQLRDACPPIIALTAHASAEERGRCRAVGMLDVLTKPIVVDDIKRVLCKYCSGVSIKEASGDKDDGVHALNPELVDETVFEQLLDSFEADGLRDLVVVFNDSFEAKLTELDVACAASDIESAGRITHAMKGTAANMGATGLQKIAAECDACARRGELPANEAVARLRTEFRRVVDAFVNFTKAA